MKKLVLASMIVLCGSCGSAFAQSAEKPDQTPSAAIASEREAARSEQRATPSRQGDPNTTGEDKVNGMEVPQMKGEPDGAGKR